MSFTRATVRRSCQSNNLPKRRPTIRDGDNPCGRCGDRKVRRVPSFAGLMNKCSSWRQYVTFRTHIANWQHFSRLVTLAELAPQIRAGSGARGAGGRGLGRRGGARQMTDVPDRDFMRRARCRALKTQQNQIVTWGARHARQKSEERRGGSYTKRNDVAASWNSRARYPSFNSCRACRAPSRNA